MGYSKRLWETDGNTSTTFLLWEQLSDAQQVAAELLGYDPQLWGAPTDVDHFCLKGCNSSDAVIASLGEKRRGDL